jgi:subtilisin family serine protease
MLITLRSKELPPLYHEDLLMVKVRPTLGETLSGPPAAMTVMSVGTVPASAPPSALATYARAGLIKRVVPLSLPAAGPVATGPLFALNALAASVVPARGPAANAGVSLVELQPGTNLPQLQASLANDPHIDAVSRVPVRYLMARPRPAATRGRKPAAPRPARAQAAAAPPAADTMWNLRKILWREARDAGLNTAQAIRVAVLDTGVDRGHPDLPGKQITYTTQYPGGAATSEQDIIGHGTHVSGTIRALIDNQLGINGISECKLSVYKIFGDETIYDDRYNLFSYFVDPVLYHSALAACLDDGIQVINLSIGGYGEPDFQEQQLFQQLLNRGVSIVAAMGNDATSQPSYPAAIPGVIAVGATSADDTIADFSNYGPHIALSAPGKAVWSTLPTYPGQDGFRGVIGPDGKPKPGQPIPRETDYDAWDGTSMATPHVTAAAACALGQYTGLSPANLKALLMRAVDQVPDMQGQPFTPNYGAGRLNLLKLLNQPG